MRNENGFTLVGLVVGMFLIIMLMIIVRGCIGCISEDKSNNNLKTEQVEKVKPQKKIETKNVKKTSTNNPETWSELLKSKPKEMQNKQEMLKSSLKNMANN